MPHLDANVQRNAAAFTQEFRVAPFDWMLPPPARLVDEKWDLILATDCVYHARRPRTYIRTDARGGGVVSSKLRARSNTHRRTLSSRSSPRCAP